MDEHVPARDLSAAGSNGIRLNERLSPLRSG
jgi:hypothetical protein